MRDGSQIENIFGIHPKDSKSKNREIPQMHMKMRPPQFMSETLMSMYTDEEEIDQMQKADKYSNFTNEALRVMEGGGVTRSEDKTFFCGNMHPEVMSLATACLAKTL